MEIVARRYRGRGKRFLTFAGVASLAALAMFLGAYMQKRGVWGERIRPYLQSYSWPWNAVRGLTAQPRRLTIDLNWEAQQGLHAQRDRALAEGLLILHDDDYVPATISSDGDRVRVKMRLKGDALDHLMGDKWSFRVRVRGEETLFGMKQMSLQHPRTRNWLYERLFHDALAREDIISLRYDFVDVTLNGKSLGIYALEEHFEKRLIENNRRREGPIIRFSEDLTFREVAQNWTVPGERRKSNMVGSYMASEVDGFQTARTIADPVLRAQYQRAVHLLDGFRRGEVSTSEAFDVQKTATYFALVDLLGAVHGALWNNIRFYYNPVTARIEPIGYDANAGSATRALLGWPRTGDGIREFDSSNTRFFATFFADQGFFEAYVSELERISQPSYLESLLEDGRERREELLAILHSEYPYYEFDTDVLHANRQYISTALDPVKGLHAYLREAGTKEIVLDVAAIHYLPLEIDGVLLGEGGLARPKSSERVILPGRKVDSAMSFREVVLSLPEGLDRLPAEPSLEIVYRVLGTTRERRAAINPLSYSPQRYLHSDFRDRATPLSEFRFLSVDEEASSIWIEAGTWTLDRPLIVPAGFVLRGRAGTRLVLANSALILSYSPVHLEGDEDSPFVVASADGTGQGLVVLQAGAPSLLRNVDFESLRNPERDGWFLTGAVTFYESDVTLSRCKFRDIDCEDGLNVIRSRFSVEGCVFENTLSDAFDADFSEGEIRDSVFLRCGNDGIDVSGSRAVVRSVRVADAEDKAVSAGEGSRVEIEVLEVSNARFALTSKDLSTLVARDVRVIACEYAAAAYCKKPEFGPGSLTVEGLDASGGAIEFLVEEGSSVEIDGELLPANARDVAKMLYGAVE